jgi:photosystem II stability/assembly factor-like uncharacterized protein
MYICALFFESTFTMASRLKSPLSTVLFVFAMCVVARGQELTADTFKGLKFRSIGPAFTSGRIADIAIHPVDASTWYVAVGSGGLWKTVNNGTTWTAVFDDQKSYSIGCVTIDPADPNTVWVGAGENVGGRHVGYGDGVYVSHDGGQTWKNSGLGGSQHISKIIVHPENSDIVWVAAQGPLWNKGGQRGIYKTTDGGTTWERTLGNDEWTGATDLVMDPENPDVLYAATWDRHRTVAAYMGGGPGSGIHKSTDGGDTWTACTSGIPKSNLGKIGLAISPFDHNVIYAAIELDRRTGGVFMSTDGGASWAKQSSAVSGATGPHYYQEIYASPHYEGTLYLMSNVVLISTDHGKTFTEMNEEKKHVDSHVVVFKQSDPDYLLFGTDGGLYETFDLTKTWRFVANLPVTQYYKLAVDDAKPFYNIFGGTQDNGTHKGPSRTTYSRGITNADWWEMLGADGHQPATEPGNPNIAYGEYQEGVLWRVDQITGEAVRIQPQPTEGSEPERFNWDAPILVSPHDPARIYVGSMRVWRSDNRGDAWRPISGDLTRDQERIELPIMGRTQSWDNAWDVDAMSNYNTITSLAESPAQEGLIYAGTDDGIIQVTEDGGKSWRKVELGNIKGVPPLPFVNDVRADLFDANVVYAALDNHKYGDFKPYLLRSTDKGKTWSMMSGDLPSNLITWRLVQDHVDRDLIFVGTEYGVFFTKNQGVNWTQLKGGLPTIPVRDLTIHRTAEDLVLATFGRGFYILDDITPLRAVDNTLLSEAAVLFAAKPAQLYVQRNTAGGQGHAEFAADNPPFGAIFTYFLKEKFPEPDSARKAIEKKLNEQKSPVPFPGWDVLYGEKLHQGPLVTLTIRDSEGNIVNVVKGTNEKGFNRVNWPLSYANRSGETLEGTGGYGGRVLVTPGRYTVTLEKTENGVTTRLAEPKPFEVVPLQKGALEEPSDQETNDFRIAYQAFQQDLKATGAALNKQQKTVDAMQRAFDKAQQQDEKLRKDLYEAKVQLQLLDKQLNGDPIKREIGEKSNLTPSDGLVAGNALAGTYGPTKNLTGAMERAQEQLDEIKKDLRTIYEETIPAMEKALREAGAPWVELQGMPK